MDMSRVSCFFDSQCICLTGGAHARCVPTPQELGRWRTETTTILTISIEFCSFLTDMARFLDTEYILMSPEY